MASTNYLTRAIFKEHTAAETETDLDFSGDYKLLVKAKSMPAPMSSPNNVETTTYEEDSQTFAKGVKQSDTKEITGNLEHDYLAAVEDIGDKVVDIIQLYGSDGIGGIAKYGYYGQISATPSDTSGIDGVLEMTVAVIPNSAPKNITDSYTVAYNKSTGVFTVAKKS